METKFRFGIDIYYITIFYDNPLPKALNLTLRLLADIAVWLNVPSTVHGTMIIKEALHTPICKLRLYITQGVKLKNTKAL